MADDSSEFAELIRLAAAGDATAIWELVARYEPHVRKVVRRYLDFPLRTRFDSTDFAQAVWTSVLRRRGNWSQITTPGQWIALLSAMARNKVASEHRRQRAQRRSVDRETPLDVPAAGEGAVLADARAATPSQVAIARERWQTLVAGLDDVQRRVVSLRLAGATYDEIAAALRISERTARRLIDRLCASFSSAAGERLS